MNDLSQLALFAMDHTNYGINFKQILFDTARITPYGWLHELFLNQVLTLSTRTQQYSFMGSLKKLLNIYDLLSYELRSAYQIIEAQDFVGLLQKLNNGEINDDVQLEEYFQKIEISRDGESISQLLVLKLKLEIPELSSEYYSKRQQFHQEVFNSLRMAATMILQGISTATKENDVAFTLRYLVENPSSANKLKL